MADDEDDVVSRPSDDADRMTHHKQSMALIAEWLKEAYPSLIDDEVALLLRFVSAQHPGRFDHNIMRHSGITAFLEAAEANGSKPSLHALLALGHLARERSESPDSEMAGRGGRILVAVMHAINTLAACEQEGGARKLFDAILRSPKGDVAKKYLDLEYATDCVRQPPPDPRQVASRSDPPTLGVFASVCSRMLLYQLVISCVALAISSWMHGAQFTLASTAAAPFSEHGLDESSVHAGDHATDAAAQQAQAPSENL